MPKNIRIRIAATLYERYNKVLSKESTVQVSDTTMLNIAGNAR